ncbi:MAG TPA: aconitate hydratase [Chloroflexia bacterium]|nr:aconitate hydratase [Chloroflexia bacterium]
MADNVTTKIIKSHLMGGDLVPGQEIALRVDQTLLQDATGTMASLQFEELGIQRVSVPLAVQYVDHNMIALDFKNPDDHRFLQSFAARYGLHFSHPGNGISHYVHLERFGKPGAVMVGADSHTTTAGALAMIAIGAGGLDVAVCMSGQAFEFESPLIVGVELRGHLSPWVQAKDVILELLRRRGVRNGLGRIFEFYGEGVATLNVTQRGTICNMIVEMGATTGLFPSDEQTREWLEFQQRPGDWTELVADEGATYDEYELIELDKLEPLIAKPSSPGNVVPVREVAGIPAAQVCVGSSVNSGYQDLAIVAAVLRDKSVAESVVMTVTPGSRQILSTLTRSGIYNDLMVAGGRMLEPACGPCVGMGQAPPSGAASVRTFNRNFPGRSGTQNDQVYLCSPATAAATALYGVITDPRDLGVEEPTFPPPVFDPAAGARQITPPIPAEEARSIVISRGPNIKPPPAETPLSESLEGCVLIVVGDDISTGDLSPDGAEVMAFRSNVAAMSKFVFRRIDPDFASRAQEWGGGFIVGGHNYGQGSSREHAALAPKQLGVRAVIARSFARIHRRNLIAQGIPPLSFVDDAGYDLACQGDRWEIPGIREALANGREEITVRIAERGVEFKLQLHFSPREREVLLSGGLLAHIREGGGNLSAGQAVSAAVDQGSPFNNPLPQEPPVA